MISNNISILNHKARDIINNHIKEEAIKEVEEAVVAMKVTMTSKIEEVDIIKVAEEEAKPINKREWLESYSKIQMKF